MPSFSRFRRCAAAPLAIVVAALLVATLASARETDPVTAEVLFQEARELLRQGKLDQACPKFLESERLDPATATLLAVATCHERQGLLATAWAEFTEAMGRARQERRKDREQLALERALALEPRLSTLKIVVPPELAQLPGLIIRRDGLELGQAVHNRELPIDGGVHRLEASAPGYSSETHAVTIAAERDAAHWMVPTLRRQPERASSSIAAPSPAALSPTDVLPPPPVTSAPLEPPRAPPPGLTGTQVLGAGLGAAGIGAATVGAAFLVGALVKKDQSDSYCRGSVCEPKGLELRAAAVDRGNMATALGIGAALFAASGVALYVWGAPTLESEQPPRLAASLRPAPGGIAASWELGF
jgi:hypothetical protein